MSALQRQALHEKGRDMLFQGHYTGALEAMLQALAEYGPHVGLLSDLIATYYMAGRLEECFQMTERLEKELVLAKPFISTLSIAKTQIFLGKIFEEKGQLEKALQTYEEAIESGRSDFQTRVRAQSQLLRLKSFLGIKTGLSELYQICIKARTDSKSLDIELEHGLMAAEVVLMGPLTAFQRVKALTEDPAVNSADLRLLVIDFAEEVLRQKIVVTGLREILSALPVAELDGFEKVIYELSLSSRPEAVVVDTNALAKNIPLMSLLRLLQLQISYSQDANLVVEMKRKMMFLLEGLSSITRSLVLKKWSLDGKEGVLIFSYQASTNRLVVNGQSLSFKAGSFPAKCFELFKDRPSIGIDEFVTGVFGGEFNETYFDRIRMAIQRLNKELAPLSGLSKVFILHKDKIEINKSILLQS
jgi:hypothetical protein